MATAAIPVTLYATVNLKDAANTTYTLLSARTGRFLFQRAYVVPLTQSGSGVQAELSLGSNSTTFDNIVNTDTTYIKVASSGLNNVVVDQYLINGSPDYMAYADLSTSGLKLRLVTQSGATTHTALIAITGIVI
jgi:hypothetical protein